MYRKSCAVTVFPNAFTGFFLLLFQAIFVGNSSPLDVFEGWGVRTDFQKRRGQAKCVWTNISDLRKQFYSSTVPTVVRLTKTYL